MPYTNDELEKCKEKGTEAKKSIPGQYFFYISEKSLLCSLRLYLFDHKYCKKASILGNTSII